MSDILHEDTFHGTKKGMRRKTVSSRRAYVNTPQAITGRLNEIFESVSLGWTRGDSKKIQLALLQINQLQQDIQPLGRKPSGGVIRKRIAELR